MSESMGDFWIRKVHEFRTCKTNITCPVCNQSTEKNIAMLEALKTLPLDSFGDDMSKCDAADFVDHAGEFFEAMVKARAVISNSMDE